MLSRSFGPIAMSDLAISGSSCRMAVTFSVASPTNSESP